MGDTLAWFNKIGSTSKGVLWRIAVCVGLLILLLALPIRMNEKGNSHIPGLGRIEMIAQDYCAEQLPKVAAATAVTYSASGILSVLEDMRVSAVVASIAPGKTLSGLNDSIKSLGQVLLCCTGLLVLGSTIIGMITFICFKLLIPVSLFLHLLHTCLPTQFPWAGNASRPLAAGAILFWLFFPATSLITGYVQSAYLDGRIEAEMEIMEAKNAKMNAVREEVLQREEAAQPQEQPSGVSNAPEESPEAAKPAIEPEPATQENAASATAGAAATVAPDSAPGAVADEEKPGFFRKWRSGKTQESQTLKDASPQETNTDAASPNPGFLSRTKDKFRTFVTAFSPLSVLKDAIQAATESVSDIVKRMIRVVVMFLLTTIVIPVTIFIFFIKIYKLLCNTGQNAPSTEGSTSAPAHMKTE